MNRPSTLAQIGLSILATIIVFIIGGGSAQINSGLGLIALPAAAFLAGMVLKSWWYPAIVALAPTAVGTWFFLTYRNDPSVQTDGVAAFGFLLILGLLLISAVLTSIPAAAGVSISRLKEHERSSTAALIP